MSENSCKECGCHCRSCDQSTLHLHVEIENLKQRLVERDRHIVTMETNFLSEADKFPDGEFAALTEELLTWQDKYSRLYESYKRVQKVNQGLEDKLLRVVDKCESEKGTLTRDVASLTQRLVDARFNVTRLQEENERYRNDLSLAIQLLQCKPANFVPQKLEQLPSELQQKVRTYMSNKRRPSECNGLPPKVERRTIKVPIPTFPPTAMVYSVNKPSADKDLSDEERDTGDGKPPIDVVSAAIVAKILEERERERISTKHCRSCTCSVQVLQVDVSTQTGCSPSRSAHSCSNCSDSSNPAQMNLRYSSSLLGSGEASQILVSLTEDAGQVNYPASQTSSSSQSPMCNYHIGADVKVEDQQNSHESKDTPKFNEETKNNANKSSLNSSWDDWSHNTTSSKRNTDFKKSELNTISQGIDTFNSAPKSDIEMPKVSTNSSPSFFRVSSTVMPSPALGSVTSGWSKNDTSGKKFHKGRGKSNVSQDANFNSFYPSNFDTDVKDGVNTYSSNDHPYGGKESGHLDTLSQSSYSLKLNQTRLLPETKLFASGDTIEVLPTDSLRYNVECERKLSNSSVKAIAEGQTVNNSSPPNVDKKDKGTRPTGPQPCSLRFQAGSNNILLDNAHSYAPVLYTSRLSSNNVSPRNNDPLIHASHSRSASGSSTDDAVNPSTTDLVTALKMNNNRTETGV